MPQLPPVCPSFMSNLSQRVVITGLGVVAPIGRDLDTLWENLSARRSGVTQLDCLPLESLPARFGGQAKCFTGDIGDFGPLEKNLQRSIKKNQKVMCREIEMGVAACQLALHHSGLGDPELRNPDRFGIVYGSDYILTRPEEFAIDNDLRGPSNSLTIREASSGASIIEAVSAIRRGAADCMLAGATGSRLEPLRALHFIASEPLASQRENPLEMSRPYDITRDGTLIGEGAGAVVLESMERAIARGAKIWGEVIAGASSAVNSISTERDNIRIAIGNVTKTLLERGTQAGVDFSTGNWHIHGCGKSEVEGDASEAAGIRDALGDLDAPVTAAKSYFGNLGAGCGAIEIVASCLAMDKGQLFPVLNTRNVDPKCPIRVSTGNEAPGDAFLQLAYSSQGQACGVLIRKVTSG